MSDKQLFTVIVVETLSRRVMVQALDHNDAERIVKEQISNEELVLDADDYDDRTILVQKT